MFVLAVLGICHTLNITLTSTEFGVGGSGTNPTISFDAATDNFTCLWYSNGRDTITGVDAVGFYKDGTTWQMVEVKSGATTATVIGTAQTLTATANTITFAFSALSTAVSTANASNSFSFIAERVYNFCVYLVPKDTTLTSGEFGCGTYHTYTPGASFTAIANLDRNLGKYLSSKTATSTVLTANTYNYTIYAGLDGNFVTGNINAGYVVWSTGTGTAFNMWTMFEIGDNTQKIDFAGQQIDTATTDSYQSGSAVSDRKQDNATGTTGCDDNIIPISAGKGITSGNLYQYTHFYRTLISTDLFCDNVLVSNSTKVCYLWKDGDATLTTNFAVAGDGRTCVTYVFTRMMMTMVMMIVFSFLY